VSSAVRLLFDFCHSNSNHMLTTELVVSDYDDGKLHIDIWTGSTTSNGGSKLLSCEDSLTPSASQIVVTNPPSSLAVNCMTPLSPSLIPSSSIPVSTNAKKL
jgi:hypothetical protein